MPSKVFTAKFESKCPICNETIYEGETVCYATAKDKKPSHERHSFGPTPPKAVSTSSEGPKGASDAGSPGGLLKSDAPVQDAATVWVFIGGYVKSSKTGPVVAALEEARK